MTIATGACVILVFCAVVIIVVADHQTAFHLVKTGFGNFYLCHYFKNGLLNTWKFLQVNCWPSSRHYLEGNLKVIQLRTKQRGQPLLLSFATPYQAPYVVHIASVKPPVCIWGVVIPLWRFGTLKVSKVTQGATHTNKKWQSQVRTPGCAIQGLCPYAQSQFTPVQHAWQPSEYHWMAPVPRELFLEIIVFILPFLSYSLKIFSPTDMTIDLETSSHLKWAQVNFFLFFQLWNKAILVGVFGLVSIVPIVT